MNSKYIEAMAGASFEHAATTDVLSDSDYWHGQARVALTALIAELRADPGAVDAMAAAAARKLWGEDPTSDDRHYSRTMIEALCQHLKQDPTP